MLDSINGGSYKTGGDVKVSRSVSPKFIGTFKSVGVQDPTVTSNRTTTYGAGIPATSFGSGSSAVVNYLKAGGWPDNLLRLGYTIAMRESGGRPDAYAPYSPTNSDVGLFQINQIGYGGQSWYDKEKLKDGSYNAAMAYKYVSQNGTNFLPWAMRATPNGYVFDWSYYAGSSDFAPGTQLRSDTEARTLSYWNSFPGAANGMFVSGKGSSINALVSNGEYVMGADTVAKYGKGTMDRINAGTFKSGGLVGGGFASNSRSMPRYSVPRGGSGFSSSGAGNSGGGSGSFSKDTYIINVNANSVNDPTAVANMVVNRLNAMNSRRQHSRSI